MRPDASKPAPLTGAASPDWAASGERGSRLLLRLMSWLSLRLGRPTSRIVLYAITAYFFLFAPEARRHSLDYLRRALPRAPTAGDRFRHILGFASTMHDRVFLLNGRLDLFDIAIEGDRLLLSALDKRGGALLMGAHLGSFEVMRAVGRSQTGRDVAMAMYAGNARKISATLEAINPRLKADIVQLGQLTAMLEIRDRLKAGALVGILGDRSTGDEPGEQIMFLGAPAVFPLGPFRLAAMLRCPLYFMAGLYLGGNRYRIVLEKIADFSSEPVEAGSVPIRAAVLQYAATVQRHCLAHPYNWFNFFDFWQTRLVARPDPDGAE
ncbi:MAG: acyl-CoA synthetase [Gammaproteobacteria bacterium]